jgi:two-component sensor histidine kinase
MIVVPPHHSIPADLALPHLEGDFGHRLRCMIETQAEMLADADQIVRTELHFAGACPAQHRHVVLCVAQELTANAIRHGFYARMIGRIHVELVSTLAETRLTVSDDGWGMGTQAVEGGGLDRIRTLIAPFAGILRLRSSGGVTADVWLQPARERLA